MTEIYPFNNAIESGLRMLVILVSAFPRHFDIEKLIFYDYMIVHSADLDENISSIHPAVPNRKSEIFVRRSVLQSGLDLFCNKGLISKIYDNSGIAYVATENSMPFIDALSENYTTILIDRSNWLINNYADLSTGELQNIFNSKIAQGKSEFNLEII